MTPELALFLLLLTYPLEVAMRLCSRLGYRWLP